MTDRRRLDLETRNRRILVMYHVRRVHRKQIATVMKMQYDAVKKVIQKYHGIERREIVPPSESYDIGYLHSER